MTITKTSEDNFTLHKQNEDYVLYMGQITPQTKRPFTLQISEVEDSSKVSVDTTCGCTFATIKIVDKNTLEASLAYTTCDNAFAKTIVINNNNKNTLLKIQGTCQ